jgi:hypothetical protein
MVNIEIKDPEKALAILPHLDPNDTVNSYEAYAWIAEMQWAIQAAVQKEEESVWKDLSSFDVDGYSAEINCLGEVRVEGKIFKPMFDSDFNEYHTTFPGPTGDSTISATHFVKTYFNKEM